MTSYTTSKKIILVLGMHRSGTSAITKGLESLGVNLGDNLLPAVLGDNDKGYFEDVEFNNLNIDILTAVGCTWESLRPLSMVDFEGPHFDVLRQRATSLIEAKVACGLCCVKDPRFSVLLPFWLNVLTTLNVEPLFVIAIRHPQSVVRSLQTGLRGEIPDAQGYYLWLVNNAEALHYTSTYKSVVVSFDAMLERPNCELGRISEALGLPNANDNGALTAYEDFLDPNLIRNRATLEDLAKNSDAPHEVQALYALLVDLADDRLRPSDPVAVTQIAALHERILVDAGFYRYADLLKSRVNTLLAQAETQLAEAGRLESRFVELELQYADLEGRYTTLLQNAAEQEAALSNYHGALTNANETLANVYQSRSWRMTAPLRVIVHKAQRARWLAGKIYGMSNRLATRDNLTRAYWLIKDHGLFQALRIVYNQLARLSVHENNPASVTASEVAELLPADQLEPCPEYTGTVDVIIPVYKGLDFTQRCIDSVLAAKTTIQHRVIVINDCSPEPELTAYIQSLKNHPELMILENPENLGFVKTVNAGMRLHATSDVLLLNSDTEVADFWLERIVAHALINEQVATVTPFSNNATICSFPTIYGKRTLPAETTLATMNAAFYAANRLASVVVPTGVGFCMFIARACINEIGLFDEEAFGKGYGEENDFCMRAQAHGWQNLLACDVLVFHAGEVSFQNSSTSGKDNALRVISRRYPDYENLIREHVVLAEADRFRIRAAASLFRTNGKSTLLMVNHALGGGTQKHLHELIDVIGSHANIISINPVLTREHLIQVHLLIQDEQLRFSFDSRTNGTQFVEFLASCGVARIHYHHIIGLLPEFLEHLRRYPAPFDFTVHDYYTICPKINLIKGDTYCGEQGVAQCNGCLAEPRQNKAIEIIAWRNRHSWLITDAQRVICPSNDTLQRMRRYYPASSYVQRYHQDAKHPEARQGLFSSKDAICVAILGSLSIAKGANLVRDLVTLINARSMNLSVRLIGSSQGLIRPSTRYNETGPYDADQVDALLEAANPDLILFPGRIPETYSYTLTEGMRTGLPILAPDVGAFPERLAYYPLGRIYDHQCTAETLLEEILNLHETELDLETPPLNEAEPNSVANFYWDFYGHTKAGGNVVDLRTTSGRSAVIIAESIGSGTYSPCAYIRLILPLMGKEFGAYESIKVISSAEALRYVADDFYTHRIAVDQEQVDGLLKHCATYGIRLIYDIDDDLLGIAKSGHPERKFYAARADAISHLIHEADVVSVSTESLAAALKHLQANIEVRPNKLSRTLIPIAQPKSVKEPIGILYMGTQTHSADFKLVEEALVQIKNTYGAKVVIYIVGVTTRAVSSKYFTVLNPPPSVACSYPLFMHWLGDLDIFDIGIAPLEMNAFNAHKSDIKFLDYSALKLVTVASKVEAYAHTIIDHDSGVLTENTHDAWVAALRGQIDSAEIRARLSENAFAYLQAQRSY